MISEIDCDDHIPQADDGFAGRFEDDQADGAKDFALIRIIQMWDPPGISFKVKSCGILGPFTVKTKMLPLCSAPRTLN